MVTKCIGADEIGKAFSAVAFLAAVMPIASNGAFRGLYDATLETFPAAFLLLTAAIGTLITYLNFYVYTQRGKMKSTETEEENFKVIGADDYLDKFMTTSM